MWYMTRRPLSTTLPWSGDGGAPDSVFHRRSGWCRSASSVARLVGCYSTALPVSAATALADRNFAGAVAAPPLGPAAGGVVLAARTVGRAPTRPSA